MVYFNNISLFNIKISKSKLIGFIAIVFSFFFFNPFDIYAYTYVPEDLKITFYGTDNSTDYCEGLTQCYNFVPNKIAKRVQIQSHKISFSEGKEYKMYISLKLSVPTDYTIYDYYLSDYLLRNYNITVNKSDFKFLYWDDFGWFNAYQWDLELTVNPIFHGSGVSFDFYKSQATNQQIWILDVLDFHSELLADSSDTNIIIDNNNKNTQDIIDNQNQNADAIIDNIDDLQNGLFDDDPLTDNEVQDFFDGIGANFATDTPISDLLLMPLTLLESYSDGISSSCASFNLGSLLGTDLIMPCVDLESLLGATVWKLIDSLISIFMFYNIAMLCVSIFDSITSLDDSFQLLYSPKHGEMSRVGIGHSRGLY